MCPFCSEAAHAAYGRSLLGDGWPFPDRVLFDRGEAFAIAGYGPQVFPYVLVLPRRHVVSLADCDRGERESILGCLNDLAALSIFKSKELTIFEHGGRSGDTCSCLEHCHLHVIDGEYPIEEWLIEDFPDSGPAIFDRESTPPPASSYLFAGNYNLDAFRIRGHYLAWDRPPSQFFRRLLSSKLRLEDWDWHAGMNQDFMVRLVTHVKLPCVAR
jgi:diadenosine tetraphosphate (Ap4A) HIT family hydrolase